MGGGVAVTVTTSQAVHKRKREIVTVVDYLLEPIPYTGLQPHIRIIINGNPAVQRKITA